MAKRKRALITGITGQDGSYLAEFLLEKGYTVYGLMRRSSTSNLDRIQHIREKVNLVLGDLTDMNSLICALDVSNPDEVYNLGAQSFVKASWNQPILTGHVTALGVTNILEAIRAKGKKVKFYQASSSEMFGKVREVPQTENTPFYPRSPYGVAKAYGHYITVNYRESYDMFNCCGILFNHESPRRGLEFVTRKITYNVARIKQGLQKNLYLGNMDAKRDWGYALDYVKAMWLMLQHKKAEDYVVATGISHSVKDFVKAAFDHVGLNWKDHVKIDPQFMRPAEVEHLIGDYSKAKKVLKWKPEVSFEELVQKMVDSDMELVKSEKENKRCIA